MKIIVNKGQVFGLVEDDNDLKILMKTQDNPKTETKDKTNPVKRKKDKFAKVKWTLADEKIVMDTIRDESPQTPNAILFKKLGRLLNRTAGSVAWRFYTIRTEGKFTDGSEYIATNKQETPEY